MSAERITYLDSSAIVKLVVRETESKALLKYLRRRKPLVSSALARTEVSRAILLLGGAAAKRCQEVLDRLELVRINDHILATAGVMLPAEMRSLDAIHLATAALFGTALRRLVTYDARMATAARALGLLVISPA
jgi:predicted nucleic acid-binding protein